MIFRIIIGQQIKSLSLYEMFIYKHDFKFEKTAITTKGFDALLCNTCHVKLKKEFWSDYDGSAKKLRINGFKSTRFFCSKNCYKIHKLKE